MSVEGKMYVSELDAGLNTLIEFITKSAIASQSATRQLVVDRAYEFTIYTKLVKQPGQHQTELQKHLVKVPVGETLYFAARTTRGKVDATDFMVNDGTGGWRINTYAKTVRRLANNIHVKSPQQQLLPKTGFNGNGPLRS